jgi:hypothetical protein
LVVVEREEKAKVTFYIDKALLKEFRAAVVQVYGGYSWGAYSEAIEAAIRLWIDQTKSDQEVKDIKGIKHKSKIYRVFNQVMRYLLENYYEELKPGDKIPLVHLQEAIRAVRGIHPTTIMRWIEAFHRQGFIRPVGPSTWELVG